jgi:hypothetical protein
VPLGKRVFILFLFLKNKILNKRSEAMRLLIVRFYQLHHTPPKWESPLRAMHEWFLHLTLLLLAFPANVHRKDRISHD